MKRLVSVVIADASRKHCVYTRLIGMLAAVAFAVVSRADDYGTIAKAVATPLVDNFDEAENAYADAAVMLRVAAARQQLMSVTTNSPDLVEVRRLLLQHFDACHRSMQEMRRLNGKMPDFDAIAKRAIAASPALVRKNPETGGLLPEDDAAVDGLARTLIFEGAKMITDAWNATKEQNNYAAGYRNARSESLSLSQIADMRCTGRPPVTYGVGLPVLIAPNAITLREPVQGSPAAKAGFHAGDDIVAVDGKQVRKIEDGKAIIDQTVFLSLRGERDSTVSVTFVRDGQTKTIDLRRSFSIKENLLDIDFDGSWNATFKDDRVALRNVSGAELTNCTLLVELVGTHGDSKRVVYERHLHYVECWPVNQRRYAQYRSSVAKGLATNESIDRVQRLSIELYSDEFRDTIAYQYAGTPAMDADVSRHVDQVTNDQQFQMTFAGQNLVSDAGVNFRHDGKFGFIPEPTITVTLIQGNAVRSKAWPGTGKHWAAGFFSEKSLRDPSFNGMNPDRVDIALQFPEAKKPVKYSWKLSAP